jgi:hypothetical protein
MVRADEATRFKPGQSGNSNGAGTWHRGTDFVASVPGPKYGPACVENLDPDVLVMQLADVGARYDAPDLLNRA